MPVEYEYPDNMRGVLICAKDDVDGAALVSAMEAIFSNEEKVAHYTYGICDFTEISTFDISHDQIFSLSKIHIGASKLNPRIVVGFATNKALVHGLVRIWMAYANLTGWEVNIEKDLPAIKRWVESKQLKG